LKVLKKGEIMAQDSVFDAEVKAWRAEGLPLYQARQRAIDDYRKYGKRKVSAEFGESPEGEFEGTPDAILLGEGNWLDANLSAESRLMFNQLFRLMFEYAQEWDGQYPDNKRIFSEIHGLAAKYMARIVRCGNLEHILDEDLQEMVAKELGDSIPWNKADLAEVCGYGLREGRKLSNEASWHITCWEEDLRSYARSSSEDWYEKQGA